MHNQLEPAATGESNGSEVAHVARREPVDTKRLGQRHDRTIDEAQTEIRESPVHFHRTCELADCRRRVGEGAANEILHEHVHRLALVAKEVVNFGKDETGDIAGTRLVDGGTKEPVVWRAFDEIVDERPGVANEPLRYRPARNSSVSSPRSVNARTLPALLGLGWGRYCSSTRARCWRMNSDRETPRSRAARESSRSASGSRAIVVAFFLVSAMEVI